MQYLKNCSNYAKLILLIGSLLAVPLVVLPFYPDEVRYLPAFVIPMLLSFLIGTIIAMLTNRPEEESLEWQSPLQRGSLPVLVAWCYAIFVGALPFVISGKMGLLLSLFESVSGWTTTGLTVVDVTEMPQIFLFHRSFMQYCGGLGFVIMMLMLAQGKQSMNLFNAEGHPDKLKPNLKQTARTIFKLYFSFLVVGTLLYKVLGMNLFESICHTMSALSTAGFSTRAGSIGEYGSYLIDLVTIFLMIIGSMNFAVMYLFMKGKLRQFRRISEFRFMCVLLLVFVPIGAISLMRDMDMGFGESLHNALFGIVSTFSTTGYSTMQYSQWPPLALGILLLFMVIGGSVGSTAGGIKLLRMYILVRFTKENIRRRLSPTRNIKSLYFYQSQGKTLMDGTTIEHALSFIACYIAILFMGTLLLTITANCSLMDAFYEFSSAFGTVGISNGVTSADASAGTLIVEMIGMVLGRLEVFIIFVGLYSALRTMKRGIQKRIIHHRMAR